jgi:hypothetical protein
MFSMAAAGLVKSLIAMVGPRRSTEPGAPRRTWRNHALTCLISHDSVPGSRT